ncbi:MAG: protein phosphatase 2C domain-containing protein, partial [Planctomycetota bacterium]
MTWQQIHNALALKMNPLLQNGMTTEQKNVAQRACIELLAKSREDPELLTRLVRELAEPLASMLHYGLFNRDINKEATKNHENFQKAMSAALRCSPSLLKRAAKFLSEEIAMKQQSEPKSGGPPAESNQAGASSPTSISPNDSGESNVVAQAKPGEPIIASGNGVSVPHGSATLNDTFSSPPVATAGSQWRFLPVEPGPEPHKDHDARAGRTEDKYSLIGARVRGKKHKHEGTNSDDWFEFGRVDPWTVIAVSDGAGSKRFSRIGAKEACRAAQMSLEASLATFHLEPRSSDKEWLESLQRTEPYFLCAGEDLRTIQEALVVAMAAAHKAVDEAFTLRRSQREYEEFLGRQIELNDFSATLLIAVHTVVNCGGQPRHFIAACQIGDGMSAAI